MPTEAYLGLGSNLGDRASNIARALDMLAESSSHVEASSLYETTPQGFSDQPRFLNAACRLWTDLDPFRLMHRLSDIEAAVGRRRLFPNAPRALDLDILVYGRLVMDSPLLTLPHPRMSERAFVLLPLSEIAPHLRHPVSGETVGTLLRRLSNSRDSIRRWGRPEGEVELARSASR